MVKKDNLLGYIVRGPRGDYWDEFDECWKDDQRGAFRFPEASDARDVAFVVNAKVVRLVMRGTMRKRNPKPGDNADAFIENGAIVIRLQIDALASAVDGMCSHFHVEPMRVTDPVKFAKGVCYALNDEEEDGTTPVHLLFDKAFEKALEDGSEGVEEAVRCEACSKVVGKDEAKESREDRVWNCNGCLAELEGEAS